ncbi:MAG: hypothetical protein ACFB4I_01565 [Cyanophyceae cyanobacterium]
MKNWEFLIQKAGDDVWQPLQASGEIEVGSYRIVAQTQRVNTEVEIRVTYYGKVTRSQKCQRQTNAEGLVAVVPFTDFQPGLWEIDCHGDLMGELMGESWQASLHLQVVPPPEAAPATERSAPSSNSEIEDAWELVASVEFEDDPNAVPVPLAEDLRQPEAAGKELPELELTLYQDTFLKGKEPILLSGRIDIANADASAHWQLFGGRLRYQLRDPRTAEVLFDAQQPLSKQALPLIFSYTLELQAWETCLLLGEVSLEVASEQDESETVPIASQGFTITADVAELLPAQGFDVQKLRRYQSAGALRRLSLFDPRKSRMNKLMRSRSSSGQILPPRISSRDSGEPISEPQLPKFPMQLASVASIQYSDAALAEESVAADDKAIAADQAFAALNLQERFWSRLSSLTDPEVDSVESETDAEDTNGARDDEEEIDVEATEEAEQATQD